MKGLLKMKLSVENSSCVCQIDNLEEHICTQDLDLNKFGLLSLKEYQ